MSSYRPTCPNRNECACPAAVCEHEEAFQALFHQLWRQLMAHVRRRVVGISAQAAEDLVADALCKVAKRRLALSDSAGWRKLAYKVVNDLIADHFRWNYRNGSREIDPSDGENPSAGDTSFQRPPEQWIITKENREQFKKALQLLSEVEQYIVARYMAGDDFQQIADALGLQVKTVRNRFAEAKAKLTALLAARQQ